MVNSLLEIPLTEKTKKNIKKVLTNTQKFATI